MKPRFLIYIAIVFVAVSCKDHSDKAKRQVEKPVSEKTVTVGIVPTLDCLPYYVANAIGLYDTLKTDIRFKTYSSLSDAAQDLLDDKIDAAYCDMPRAIGLQQTAPHFCAEELFVGEMQLISNRKARLRTPRQLEKRLVAISRNSISDYICDQTAISGKIKAEDIFRPQINNIFVRQKMVEDNQIEAAVLPQPFALRQILLGTGHIIFSSQEPNSHSATLLISQAKYKSKKAQFNILHKGYLQALNKMRQRPACVDSILHKVYNLDDVTADSVCRIKLPVPAKLHSRDFDRFVPWTKKRGLWKSDKRGVPLIARN